MQALERELCSRALAKVPTLAGAARLLGVKRDALRRRLTRFGLATGLGSVPAGVPADRMISWSAAAKKTGVDLATYAAHRAAGHRRCSSCLTWHPASAFTAPTSRRCRRLRGKAA